MKKRLMKLFAIMLAFSMTVGLAVPAYADEIIDQDIPAIEIIEESATPAEETAEIVAGDTEEAAQEAADAAEITDEEAADEDTETEAAVVDDEEEAAQSDDEEAIEEAAEEEVKAAEAAAEGEVKTYSINASVTNSSGGVAGMYAMEDITVTPQENGTYLVKFHQQGNNRPMMALVPDATDDSKELATNHQVTWYGSTNFYYVICIGSLDATYYATYNKSADVNAMNAWGNIQTIVFDKESMVETEAPAVTAAEMIYYEAVKPDPEPTPVAYEAAPVDEQDVSGQMYVSKAGDTASYSMFKAEIATAVKVDGKIYGTIYVNPASSQNFTYANMFFGTRTELIAALDKGGKFDVVGGKETVVNEKKVQAYHFVLDASAENTAIPVCVMKGDLTAKSPYNSSELVLNIPEIPTGSSSTDPDPEPEPEPENPTPADPTSLVMPEGVSEAGIQVVKDVDSTAFTMFKVTESQALDLGNGNVLVHIVTSSASFDKIFFGSKDAENKSGYFQGTARAEGGFEFTFEVPATLIGETTEVALGKKTGPNDWYTTQKLNIVIPKADKAATIADAGIKMLAGGSDVEQMFKVTASSAMKAGDGILINLTGKGNKGNVTRLYLGSRDDSPKTPVITGTVDSEGISTFTFTVSADAEGTWIPVVAGFADTTWDTTQNYFMYVPQFDREFSADYYVNGTYDIYGNAWSALQREANKSFPVDTDSELVVSGDKIQIKWTTRTRSFDKLYFGTLASEAEMDAAAVDAQTSANPELYDYREFTVTLPKSALGSPIPFVRHTADRGWDTTQDYLVLSDYLVRTGDADPIPDDPEPEPEPVKVEDGVYKVTAETGAAMFKIVDAVLTVKDGQMSAVVTLSGTGYDYLYNGTGAEADKDTENWIPFVENAEGKYTYTIKVDALDTPVAVSSHSQKNNSWYDRTITFDSSTLEKIGDVNEDPENPGENPENPGENPSDTNPDEESKHEEDLSGSTSQVDNSTALKDGVYTPDSFAFSGGTGKVNITCPKVTVTNGQAYATIVFSSSSYEYVKASGNTYYTTGGAGSTFVIPVELNKNNKIIGMTTKMTASHEIEYTIFVYLAAATGAEAGANGNGVGEDNKLDEKAPEIIGLKAVQSDREIKSEYLKIFDYEGGIKLLEIAVTKDSVLDPEYLEKKGEKKDAEPEAEKKDVQTPEEEATTKPEKTLDEIRAELYKKDVVKYLIVPEGAELPAGLDKQVIVVTLPVKSVYASSDDAVQMLAQLGLLDKITSVGFEKDACVNADLKKAMEDGSVVFGGPFDKIDSKSLVKQKTDLVIETCAMVPLNLDVLKERAKTNADIKVDDVKELTRAQYEEALYGVTEKCATLNVPVFFDRSADEADERAAADWILAYGMLFGCEKEAQAIYDAKILQLKEK